MYFYQNFEKAIPDKHWVKPGEIEVSRPQPIIKVDDIAYVIWEFPDLAKQERFLVDFGMTVAAKTEDCLYMRGTGAYHHIYIARRGPKARFIGHAYHAASRDDLVKLSETSPDASVIEAIGEPGGGERTVLRDPGGWRVEVVYGMRRLDEIPTRKEALPCNTPYRKTRINKSQRSEYRPTPIVRLGHVVLQACDFAAMTRWYMAHFGHIPSDVQTLVDGRPVLAFMRLDRADRPADHHTLVIAGGIQDACEHSAYETIDADAIGQGNNYLKERGYRHAWGIGRHLLGSQIFDYWYDPHGFELEHYADGDTFDASHPTQYSVFSRGSLWLWGDDLPAPGVVAQLKLLATIIRQLLKRKTTLAHVKKLLLAQQLPPRPWLR